MQTSDAQALAARLVQAISTLEPERIVALENCILLLENGQDLRRSKGGVGLGAGTVDSGDTAFMMVCVALVQLMTIPGLALFYGGLSQAPNVLATVMQSFSITCLVTILWLICGYSISFDRGVHSSSVVGGSGMIWLNSTNIMKAEVGTIPLSLHVTYQGTFAVLTAAIITGSVAERMRFGPANLQKSKVSVHIYVFTVESYCVSQYERQTCGYVLCIQKSHYVQEIAFATICAGREITISKGRREESCTRSVWGPRAQQATRQPSCNLATHVAAVTLTKRAGNARKDMLKT